MNDFQEMFVSQLKYISANNETLVRTCEYLKNKKVIENSNPFNVELIGKILEQDEVNSYTKNCTIKDADIKFLEVLFDLENNTTSFVNCSYNKVIDTFIRSKYVDSLIKNKLSIYTNKKLSKMNVEEVLDAVEKQKDLSKLKLLKIYLLKFGTPNVKKLIKK